MMVFDHLHGICLHALPPPLRKATLLYWIGTGLKNVPKSCQNYEEDNKDVVMYPTHSTTNTQYETSKRQLLHYFQC